MEHKLLAQEFVWTVYSPLALKTPEKGCTLEGLTGQVGNLGVSVSGVFFMKTVLSFRGSIGQYGKYGTFRQDLGCA